MGAENAARERRDPSPSPAVADARVTPSSADNLPTPRVGADASAPPPGGAPPRPSTPTPAVASSSEGEAPAAPDDAANVAAPSEQATGARKKREPKIETGTDEATVARMRVKEEMAIAQLGGELVEELQGELCVRNAKGGVDDETTGSGILERKHGGPVGREGFNGTSQNVQERTATVDGMLRIPDESQGQNSDPETHASGIPSINCPVTGLIVHEAAAKKEGG